MGTARLFGLFAIVTVLVLSSCSRDPLEILPGSWDTSDGGVITFNADGSGTVTDSEYFLYTGFSGDAITDFTWSTSDQDVVADANLIMEFDDEQGFEFSIENPINFNGKNEVTIGVDVILSIDLLTLTRQ